MKEIKAYIRNDMADTVLDSLATLPGAPGVTLVSVRGFGHTKGGGPAQLVEKIKLEIVVPDEQVETIINCIIQHARTGTGHFGDGKIFISQVDTAIRIRTGERGESAV